MKKLIVLLLLSHFAFAKPFVEIDNSDPTVLRQDGHFLTVRIIKSEPIRIFILGQEEAQVDLSNLLLTVRQLKPYPAQKLGINKSGDHYVLSGSPFINNIEDLEVTARIGTKVDKFNFKLIESTKKGVPSESKK
jgi:hypothetical protein